MKPWRTRGSRGTQQRRHRLTGSTASQAGGGSSGAAQAGSPRPRIAGGGGGGQGGFRGGRRRVVASAVRLDELDDRGGGVVGPCEQWSIRGLGRATLMRHVLWCLRA